MTSNIRSIYRDETITKTTPLGSTAGAFAIATGAFQGADTRGSAATDGHFYIVPLDDDGDPKDNKPPRYLNLNYQWSGTAEATADARVAVEFWLEDESVWVQCAPMQMLGTTGLDAAANTTVGQILTVAVPRGATIAKFFVPVTADFLANQTLKLWAYPDNND